MILFKMNAFSSDHGGSHLSSDDQMMEKTTWPGTCPAVLKYIFCIAEMLESFWYSSQNAELLKLRIASSKSHSDIQIWECLCLQLTKICF